MAASMQSALEHFRAGRFNEAAAEYQTLLHNDPKNAIALLHLGMLKSQNGAAKESISLLRRSLQIDPSAPGAHYTLAQVLAADQQIPAAIDSLRNALERRPDWIEALIGLGTLLGQSGQADTAESTLRRAIQIKPDAVEALVNLGNVLQQRGRFTEAIDAYRKAVEFQPSNIDAHTNLGSALAAVGNRNEAIAEYQIAVGLNPKAPIPLQNLGFTLLEQRKWAEALDVYKRTVELKPDFPEAWLGLGNALRELRRPDEAVEAFKKAIRFRPNYVEAYHNLANAEHAVGHPMAAVDAYRQAIALGPTFVRSYINLGCLLQTAGKLDEAEALLRKALALQPDYHVTLCNLGNVMKDAGKIEEANDLFRRALEQDPTDVLTHSNLAYSVHFDPRCTPQDILRENQRFDAMHAAGLMPAVAPRRSNGSNRRLRIGYFGAHFRTHCQSFFTVPLFENHDRGAFEIFCYAEENQSDAITDRLRASVDHWRDVSRLNDAEAADVICGDEIDVLVDLTMHMGRGRPLVMARKPAAIQVTWLAYPGTTGLSAMDFRLTDPQLDPPSGESDADYSERSYRLRDTFWCYDPLIHASQTDLPPGPLPSDDSGFITFGCLNNFCKVTERTLALWSRVLRSVDRSQLLLMAGEGAHRQWIQDYFSDANVDATRIRFEKYRPREQYLRSYEQIDLGLDTIPYNGHTTSLDSFWMGVPVITRVGSTVVGRAGLSQLTNLGLTDLAAFDDDSFVEIAVTLANDLFRRRELRKTLRARMQSSPLMDHERFARSMEAFFRYAVGTESRADQIT